MKINDERKRYELVNLKVGECFKDKSGEIYIKTEMYSDVEHDNKDGYMILCVSLKSGEIVHFYQGEEVEHLPNACLNIEG